MIITGRWERNSYTVIRSLGQGGTGKVYLVRAGDGSLRAMKVSADLTGITHEHRMLTFLNRRAGPNRLGAIPRVYELDDFQEGGTVYHYIITQYCPGKNLSKYMGRLGNGDAAAIGLQIIESLELLHSSGLILGDLKPSNVLYEPRTKRVFIIDYGSVSVKGQNLKQYTPGYDRASWGAGSRIADEKFDIFALGVLLAGLLLGEVRRPQGDGLAKFVNQAATGIRHAKLRDIVIRALRQDISECGEIAGVFSDIMTDTAGCESRETGLFVGVVGAASVLAFIFSLAYYYQ